MGGRYSVCAGCGAEDDTQGSFTIELGGPLRSSVGTARSIEVIKNKSGIDKEKGSFIEESTRKLVMVEVGSLKTRRTGVQVDVVVDTEFLTISSIEPGSIFEEWNKVNANAQIQVGDMIVQVNGVRGSAGLLAQACSGVDDCVFILELRLSGIPVEPTSLGTMGIEDESEGDAVSDFGAPLGGAAKSTWRPPLAAES